MAAIPWRETNPTELQSLRFQLLPALVQRRQLFGAVALTAGLGTPARGVQPTTSAVPDGSPFAARTPDGLVLSGRAYGDPTKPEILLVHGLCMCRLCWDRQLVTGLVDRFRVVTFDLRGTATRTSRPTRPPTPTAGSGRTTSPP